MTPYVGEDLEWITNSNAIILERARAFLSAEGRRRLLEPDGHKDEEAEALSMAAGMISVDIDELRERVAMSCAEWFDASAFEDCCPKCGGETYTAKYGPECSAGCDTSILTCSECGWQGDPE